MPEKLKSILTIAGSDPTGGAGIQADIRSIISMGFHPLSAITAVTSQNSSGIQKLGVIPPEVLKSQLESIFHDVVPDAVKVGMLGSQENLEVVYDFLNKYAGNIPIVLDPVLKASADNNILLKGENLNKYINNLKALLFPLVTVITPNKEEFEFLTGKKSLELMELSEILSALNLKNLIITSGIVRENVIYDILSEGEIITFQEKPKINCHNLHGSGCVFSSILSCELAKGKDIKTAFGVTSWKMKSIIEKSVSYKLGNSTYGPLNLNNYTI
ncbi:MAG: hydroxymethylpyrimidine/phosphomethylpyrimidine kinase [Muribaculaceae bacterium]|nr:hydroxymethylpyrimidine/phosphomethylpyrimidine kinase [Muribaculaceae bacterium]